MVTHSWRLQNIISYQKLFAIRYITKLRLQKQQLQKFEARWFIGKDTDERHRREQNLLMQFYFSPNSKQSVIICGKHWMYVRYSSWILVYDNNIWYISKCVYWLKTFCVSIQLCFPIVWNLASYWQQQNTIVKNFNRQCVADIIRYIVG